MKYIIKLNNKKYEVDVTESDAVLTSITDAEDESSENDVIFEGFAPKTPKLPRGEQVVAPMPGSIISINTKAGARVKAGDVMFILEAMKMENEIVAPTSGVVKQILVNKGQQVDTDAVLAVLS